MRAASLVLVTIVALTVVPAGALSVAAADRPAPPGAACPVTLAELRRAALAHGELTASGSARRRARLAALLPDVGVRAGRGQAWADPFAGPRAVDDDIARRESVDVRLSWQLDRLVFEPAEPALVASERAAARARLELEDEVTARYFRWRRAELDADELPGPRERLAADEAWAALDAVSGGALARRCPRENLR